MESFLLQATVYLSAAVLAVPLAARLGLGSVLGYLAAGIVIGPVLGLVGGETEELRHFAEFGVVVMLFLIGLELEPRALWDMRMRLLGLGGLQILATVAAVAGLAALAGADWRTGIALGFIFALSSTAIVLQTLTEKGLMATSGGRSSFSVLLTQDIAVIPMLAALPLLASAPATPQAAARPRNEAGRAAEAARALIEQLPAWGVTVVTVGAVAAIVLAGVYLTRPLFRFIHAARLREMYTAFALLIVVGIGFVMDLVGLSPALGTFLAGVVLANSEFRHELEADLEPFKGLLLGLFFITVGAGIDVGVLFQAPLVLLGATLALMAVKGLVLFALGWAFRLHRHDHWLFTLSLAQAGEFGFVLVAFSRQQGVLPEALAQSALLVIALSMLVTPLAFLFYAWLTRRGPQGADHRPADDIDERQPIIIAGVGRFGQVVNRMLQTSGFRAVVLDRNLATVQLLRTFGFRGYFGDPTRADLLQAAGLAEARVLVAALDDKEANTRLVAYARRERPDLHIVARARDRAHVYELYKAGADDMVRELFDSSLRAGRYVLENMGLSEFEAHELEATFYQMDREAVRELAGLWDPDTPVEENAAYVARARKLNKDLETELLGQIQSRHKEEERGA